MFQKSVKKSVKKFCRLKKTPYFCRWRDGRVVDCGGLENRCAARHRGFESLSLRKENKDVGFRHLFLFYCQAYCGRYLRTARTDIICPRFLLCSGCMKLFPPSTTQQKSGKPSAVPHHRGRTRGSAKCATTLCSRTAASVHLCSFLFNKHTSPATGQ